MSQNLSSAAVVIGALRVNNKLPSKYCDKKETAHRILADVYTGVNPERIGSSGI